MRLPAGRNRRADARNGYCPGTTAANANAPLESVLLTAARRSDGTSGLPIGASRTAIISAGADDEFNNNPDTRAAGTGDSCTSIEVRSSPEASDTTVACADDIADGWNVVGYTRRRPPVVCGGKTDPGRTATRASPASRNDASRVITMPSSPLPLPVRATSAKSEDFTDTIGGDAKTR